jgi:hypothetical protein
MRIQGKGNEESKLSKEISKWEIYGRWVEKINY